MATATSCCAAAEVLLTHAVVKTRRGVRIRLAGRGVARGRVGFIFLHRGTIVLFLSHMIFRTVCWGLSVGFMFLLGAAVAVLASYMFVGAGLSDGACVAGVIARSAAAGFLGAVISSVFTAVVCIDG